MAICALFYTQTTKKKKPWSSFTVMQQGGLCT